MSSVQTYSYLTLNYLKNKNQFILTKILCSWWGVTSLRVLNGELHVRKTYTIGISRKTEEQFYCGYKIIFLIAFLKKKLAIDYLLKTSTKILK